MSTVHQNNNHPMSTATVIVVSLIVCSLIILILMVIVIYFISSSIWRKNRITNRKQYCKKRVLDELQHNIRYNTPDSLPVNLSGVQPQTTRRQSLPAIYLCPTERSTTLSDSSSYLGPSSSPRMSYGSLELMRTKVRRFSEVGPPSSQSSLLAGSNDRVRKISLDSQVLSRICEESADIYENSLKPTSYSQPCSTSSPIQLDGSTSSLIDTDLYCSHDDLQHSSGGCGLGSLHFTVTCGESTTDSLMLIVHISRASYLRSGQTRETCSVYVKISLLPTTLKIGDQRTPLVTSMGNPSFNHSSIFQIERGNLAQLTQTERPQLQLTVKEARKLESNKIIGYVWFDLTSIVSSAYSTEDGFNSIHKLPTNPLEISREIFGENKVCQYHNNSISHTVVNIIN